MDCDDLHQALMFLFLQRDYDESLVNFIDSLDGPEAILPIARGVKDEGNACFKQGKPGLAMEKYDRALKLLCFCAPLDSALDGLFRELALSLMLNFAACSLKLGNYDEAGKVCSVVLDFDTLNVKALYRRAALLGLNLFEEAWCDLTKAVDIEPSNKDIMREIERVESRLGKVSDGCRGGSRKRKIDLVTPMNAVKEPVTGGGSRDEFLAKEDEPIEVLSATLSASLSPPVHKASFDDFSDCSQVGMECEGGGSDSKKDMNGSFSPLQGKKSLRFLNRKRKDNVLSLTPEMYDKVQKGEQLSFYHPFQKCRLTVKIHNPSNTKVGIGRLLQRPTPLVYLGDRKTEMW